MDQVPAVYSLNERTSLRVDELAMNNGLNEHVPDTGQLWHPETNGIVLGIDAEVSRTLPVLSDADEMVDSRSGHAMSAVNRQKDAEAVHGPIVSTGREDSEDTRFFVTELWTKHKQIDELVYDPITSVGKGSAVASFAEFVTEWRCRVSALQLRGLVYPDLLLAFKLLECINLTPDDVADILHDMDAKIEANADSCETVGTVWLDRILVVLEKKIAQLSTSNDKLLASRDVMPASDDSLVASTFQQLNHRRNGTAASVIRRVIPPLKDEEEPPVKRKGRRADPKANLGLSRRFAEQKRRDKNTVVSLKRKRSQDLKFSIEPVNTVPLSDMPLLEYLIEPAPSGDELPDVDEGESEKTDFSGYPVASVKAELDSEPEGTDRLKSEAQTSQNDEDTKTNESGGCDSEDRLTQPNARQLRHSNAVVRYAESDDEDDLGDDDDAKKTVITVESKLSKVPTLNGKSDTTKRRRGRQKKTTCPDNSDENNDDDVSNDEEERRSKRLNCQFCDHISEGLKEAVAHKKSHTYRFPCPKCDYVAKKMSVLRVHIEGIHEQVKYPCDQCDYRSTTEMSLRRHIRDVHNKLRHKCSHCDKTFSSSASRRSHEVVIHEGRRFLCHLCGFSTRHSSKLSVHKAKVHEGLRNYCDQCDFSSPDRTTFLVHVRTRHEGVTYPCSEEGCHFVGKNPRALRHHVSSRHLGKRYPCDMCDFKALRSDNLREHKKNVHYAFKGKKERA